MALLILALPWATPDLSAATPRATPYAWRNVAIHGGGFVPGLVFHPHEPGLLYARTDVGGAFRHDAAADRWLALNDDLARSQFEWLGIWSLALDPADPDRVYLAAGSYRQVWGDPGALKRSRDRGRTWETFPLPVKLGGNADGRNTGERLLLLPSRPDSPRTLLLGTPDDGLWCSTDDGETWQPQPGLPAGGVSIVFAAPGSGAGVTPLRVFAATTAPVGPPLWQSDDRGETWSAVPDQPIVGWWVHQAAFDAAGDLYVAYGNGPGPNGITAGALWRRSAADGRWHNLTPALADGRDTAPHGFAGLALHPTRPGVVLVASLNRWNPGNELWLSPDAGRTWRPRIHAAAWDSASAPYVAGFRPHWISSVALDPHHPRQVWFVTGYGLWFTADIDPPDGSAPRWQFRNAGLEETVAEDLVSPPFGPPLLSALGDIGGFRHEDLDTSPRAGTFTPGAGSSSSLDAAGLDPRQLVRTHSGPGRAARSDDGGLTWRSLTVTPPEAETHGPGRLAIAADASRMVWLPKASGPYWSEDDGATWTRGELDFVSHGGHLTASVVADRVDPLLFHIYDPAGGRCWVSRDGGRSFALVGVFATEAGWPRAEPRQRGRLWLPTPKGLYVSQDNGARFLRLAAVDAAYQVGFGRAAPGAERDAVYVHGRVSGQEGIFRSDDSGLTWLRIDDPAHRYGWLRAVVGDGQVHGRVYLGTSGRGIIVGDPR